MATAVTSAKIGANFSLKLYDHDPGGTGAVVVSTDGGTTKNYLPMALYESFFLDVMLSLSTSVSGPTLVEIVAAEDSAGTNATAILTSGTIAMTLVGQNSFLEVTAAQIKEVGAAGGFNFTHVTGRITCSNAGDECVVLMGRGFPKFPQAALTTAAGVVF